LKKVIAVLGAGIQGCCIALELARRGHQVHLYDEADDAVCKASLHNEGKLHLGFVYANEANHQTAKLMVSASHRFFDVLDRLIDLQDFHQQLSSPFYYAVHKQSMVNDALIRNHFSQIESHYHQIRQKTNLNYLNIDHDFVFKKLTSTQLSQLYDPEIIKSAYKTNEYSCDPAWMAERFREAIKANPLIEFRNQSKVTNVQPARSEKISVSFKHQQTNFNETYNYAVNCLWNDRLKIDSLYGIKEKRAWLWRNKLAINIETKHQISQIPSTTLVLGPFGDLVNFADRKFYLSWYPQCMNGQSMAVTPNKVNKKPSSESLDKILQNSFKKLSQVVPNLSQIKKSNIVSTSIDGAVIFALGNTDIDDHHSQLHSRHTIGVNKYKNYYSINTGKYCAAPYFALQLAEQLQA